VRRILRDHFLLDWPPKLACLTAPSLLCVFERTSWADPWPSSGFAISIATVASLFVESSFLCHFKKFGFTYAFRTRAFKLAPSRLPLSSSQAPDNLRPSTLLLYLKVNLTNIYCACDHLPKAICHHHCRCWGRLLSTSIFALLAAKNANMFCIERNGIAKRINISVVNNWPDCPAQWSQRWWRDALLIPG